MQLFTMKAQAIDRFGSNVAITHLVRSRDGMQVACATLPPGGSIGRHPAASNQLLFVADGDGMVSGDDGVQVPIARGQAVLWNAGEMHETTSAHGMIALILEGPGVTSTVL